MVGGATPAVPAEHGVHLMRAADADVVGHEGFEERPGPAGVVEDQGAAHLHLAHGQLPPVAGGAVRSGEGVGMAVTQRSKNPATSAGPKRSQMACSASGSAQVAKPLSRAR